MSLNTLLKRCLSFNSLNRGFVCFKIGLFLLPSSALLSGIFLFLALVCGSFQRADSYWRDYWNYPLLIAGSLMFIGSIGAYSGWLALVGLANWIPFFWCFWGFQPYLLTSNVRKECSLWLVAGTIPVLLTGFGQLWLGWEGPWQLFDGLIIWFITPGGSPNGRLSGLFDYANIAAAWLAVIWPFCLAALLQPFLRRRNRSMFFLLAIWLVIALLLTQSRNAWGGLIVAVPLVLGISSWFWLLPIMFLCALPIVFSITPGINVVFQEWARYITPDVLWMRLNDLQFIDSRPVEATRVYQWQVALSLIAQKPLLGWGAAAFSTIYVMKTGIWHGHAHNLPLEMAISHGVLVSILLNIFVFTLLICSFRKCIFDSSFKSVACFETQIFERAWWAACFILICFYATDLPLFDSRINMVGWILLAGLRCTFKSSENNI